MGYRPEFIEALELLAGAISRVEAAGHAVPTLVGGAAVELYTLGDVESGDFDLVEGSVEAMEAALLELGFERPEGAGRLLRGLVHPELDLGVEFVSAPLMDGKADRDKIRIFDLPAGSIRVVPAEDLIADRMGQAYSPRGLREDMVSQARRLLELVGELDDTYLDRRIKEETGGEYDLAALRALGDD